MNTSTARFALGLGIPGALAALAVVPWILWSGDLPDPIASHFSGFDKPDGSSSAPTFALTFFVVVAVGVIIMIVTARRQPARVGDRMFAFLGGSAAGLGAAILSQVAWTQRGLASWTDATSGIGHLAWVIGVSIAGGALAAYAATALEIHGARHAGADMAPNQSMNIADGEAIAWTGGLSVIWPLLLALPLTALGIGIALGSALMPGLIVLAATVVTLLFASIRVQAGPAGLSVSYGVFPWPRTHIALDQIQSASAIDVVPMQWGGWGYRGSLKLMKQAAVVLRKGPGIKLDLAKGRTFVVTVDDPDQAVALLNGYATKRPSAG